MLITDLIERYYIIWVVIAVTIGMIFPGISIASIYSPLLLGLMIGFISLKLHPSNFVNQDLKSIILIVLLHWLMPLIGFLLAIMFSLSNSLLIGFVMIGAVTPEFATPVITDLSKGDTELSSSVLVIAGLSSIVTIPVFTFLLIEDGTSIILSSLVSDLFLILILPMIVAIILKSWKFSFISRYEHYYSSIATIMLILLIGIATAANSFYILTQTRTIAILVIIVLIMNVIGYGLGFLTGLILDHKKKITAVYSIGMKDFAVGITLILTSGLASVVALPAVLFGIIEILTSSLLVKYFNSAEYERS